MIRENPSAALGVLGTFDMLGASGKYGFCEAVDFAAIVSATVLP